MDNSNNNDNTLSLGIDNSDLECNDEELTKYLKIQFVLKEIKELAFTYDGNRNPKIKKVLQALSVNQYLKLSDKESDCLLDLSEFDEIDQDLSFADQEELKTLITKKLIKTLKPIVEYGKFMEAEMPGIFGKENIFKTDKPEVAEPSEKVKMSPERQKLLDLYKQKQASDLKLYELQQKKCALLKQVLEIKYGPDLVQNLELLEQKSVSTQMKADALKNCFSKNWLESLGKYSISKALSEAEGYLDEELNKREASKKSDSKV